MDDQFLLDCGGPFDLKDENTISCWENEPTSGAETAIINFLKSQPQKYLGKRLLHIGTGNGDLAGQLGPGLSEYVGLTISLPEVEHFNRLFGGSNNLSVMLLNKYDPRAYGCVPGQFDLIVDTLLKSSACCERHFQEMMEFFSAKLLSGGEIITTQSGVEFGWRGNVKRAFTPGAQLDPSIAKFRTVGIEGLKALGKLHDLSFITADSFYRQASEDIPDTILILQNKAET
jgi:hypothetical protein